MSSKTAKEQLDLCKISCKKTGSMADHTFCTDKCETAAAAPSGIGSSFAKLQARLKREPRGGRRRKSRKTKRKSRKKKKRIRKKSKRTRRKKRRR